MPTHGLPTPTTRRWFASGGTSERDEAERFADLVAFLRDERIVTDCNQIALLLHSVREEHSRRYLDALAAKGIPAFCPRARGFFDVPEIRHLVACFAVLFGWVGEGRGKAAGRVLKLAKYVDAAIIELGGVDNSLGWCMNAHVATEWREH